MLKRLCWRWLVFGSLTLPVLLWQGLAQEFDTVISSRNRRAYTILDQIDDARERQALVQLFALREPKEKAELAGQFLDSFSRSWLLAQVHEIAAKAWIDLGDFERALKHGSESLRLLPENPLLLVPLANVQVQKLQLEEAQASARQALEQLDTFAPPLSIPGAEWPALQRQLKASCYFVLGRAATTEALSLSAGENRNRLLQRAGQFLQQARSLNPLDAEIPYLLGLSLLPAGRSDEAALSFASVYQQDGPLQRQALEQLKRIHAFQTDSTKRDFSEFLAVLTKRAQQPPPSDGNGADQPPSLKPAHQKAEYAGSDACRSCHAGQHHNWQQTGMARMFRPYDPRNVIGDFESKETFYAGDQPRWDGVRLEVTPSPGRFAYAQMFKDDGRHYFRIMQRNGRWVRYSIDYTIGSKWQQAYATRLPNGQIHVFPIQYNVLHKRWINFWNVIDPEGSERADVRTFERFSPTTSYHANCAVCHTSQLRNTLGGGFEANFLEFREPGINCEMCHGPSARHAGAMKQGQPYNKLPSEPPVDFTGISSGEYLAICGQCHRQSAVRDPGPKGELNYSGHAVRFYPDNKSRPFGEFSRKAFYKDGRFRETTFIVESLQRSGCFQKGQANCGHCHDVHGNDAAANPKSLRYLQEPDRMCTQCHSKWAQNAVAHTRHPASSESSRCVSCHMPAIVNSLLFQARTHEIDDIPDAAKRRQFGRESPNACLVCHSGKDSDWLASQLDRWQRTPRNTSDSGR
jgi:predicted CXXCH cytochrome family protein